MRAVEIGRAVAAAQIGRIVAVVEESQSALLIGGVGVGVGDAGLESVAEALFQVRLSAW